MITMATARFNEAVRLFNRLPVFTYMDQEYFVDFRLKEMRTIDDPFKRFPFCFISDPELKAQLRALRAEFSTTEYIAELDG
jgi:hypothetical protein